MCAVADQGMLKKGVEPEVKMVPILPSEKLGGVVKEVVGSCGVEPFLAPMR